MSETSDSYFYRVVDWRKMSELIDTIPAYTPGINALVDYVADLPTVDEHTRPGDNAR